MLGPQEGKWKFQVGVVGVLLEVLRGWAEDRTHPDAAYIGVNFVQPNARSATYHGGRFLFK